MNASDNAADIAQKNREAGQKAYNDLSRAINSSIPSDWLRGFMEEFGNDHPTLQAGLYRKLNEVMRERHTFETDAQGNVTCTDGRIAGNLPSFIVNGYIPFI